MGIEDILAVILVFLARVINFADFFAVVRQRQTDALVQVSQLAQTSGQRVVVVFGNRENLRVGMELDSRTRIGSIPRDGHIRQRLALTVLLHKDLSLTVDGSHQVVGQSVDAGNTHAVQTAGHLVTVLAELTARVQHRQDHLQGGTMLFGMHSRRDTTTVVRHLDGVAFQDANLDVRTITGQRLVDTVVHHLIDQMMQASLGDIADIHRRSLPNGLKSFQHLNAACRILIFLFHFVVIFQYFQFVQR